MNSDKRTHVHDEKLRNDYVHLFPELEDRNTPMDPLLKAHLLDLQHEHNYDDEE
jgi:hypothetical protein